MITITPPMWLCKGLEVSVIIQKVSDQNLVVYPINTLHTTKETEHRLVRLSQNVSLWHQISTLSCYLNEKYPWLSKAAGRRANFPSNCNFPPVVQIGNQKRG